MKYNAGDKVKIKSLEWFNTNKCDGRVMCDGLAFVEFMTEYCGKELTIDYIYTGSDGKQAYVMKEPKTAWRFTDSMIECLVEQHEIMVSLSDACSLLYDMLTTQYIGDYEYVTAPAYDDVYEFVDDFCKSLNK